MANVKSKLVTCRPRVYLHAFSARAKLVERGRVEGEKVLLMKLSAFSEKAGEREIYDNSSSRFKLCENIFRAALWRAKQINSERFDNTKASEGGKKSE